MSSLEDPGGALFTSPAASTTLPSNSLTPVDATTPSAFNSRPESTAPAQLPEPAPRNFITNRDVRSLFSNPRTEPIIERYYRLTRHLYLLCLIGLLVVFFQLSHFDLKEAWYNFLHPGRLQSHSLVPFIAFAAFYIGGVNTRNPNKRFDIGTWVHRRGWVVKPPTPSPEVLENLERKRRAQANTLEDGAADTRPTTSLLSTAQTASLIAPVLVFNDSFHFIGGMFTSIWALDLYRQVQKLETVSDADRHFVIMTIVSESIMVVIGLVHLIVLKTLTKRIRAMLDHELLLKLSVVNSDV